MGKQNRKHRDDICALEQLSPEGKTRAVWKMSPNGRQVYMAERSRALVAYRESLRGDTRPGFWAGGGRYRSQWQPEPVVTCQYNHSGVTHHTPQCPIPGSDDGFASHGSWEIQEYEKNTEYGTELSEAEAEFAQFCVSRENAYNGPLVTSVGVPAFELVKEKLQADLKILDAEWQDTIEDEIAVDIVSDGEIDIRWLAVIDGGPHTVEESPEGMLDEAFEGTHDPEKSLDAKMTKDEKIEIVVTCEVLL